jgi:two-component system, LytTR family, response regulator
MRVIIADDEFLARDKLRLMLASEPNVKVIAECQTGGETVRALIAYKPDLMFLDVRMPDLDGFEVLGRVPRPDVPLIVFTTAFDRHAIRAFEAHALDYLLKPFDHERLHQALERARNELEKANTRAETQRILQYLSETRQHLANDRRLIVRTGGRVIFLSFDEIDWVEAAANYVRIYVGKQSYLLRRGIGEIAERLDQSRFIRIHRSVIVNVQKIKELQPVNSGEYIVVLKDGKELSCSRGYRSGLQELVDRTL